MARLFNVLYDDKALMALKRHVEAGKPAIFEGVRGKYIQNFYEAKPRFTQNHMGYWRVEIDEWWQEGERVYGLSYYRDVHWNPEATESKRVRPKDLVAPTFSDKLGQVINKGDLVVASDRDGSLVIGQYTRATPVGTVYLRTIGERTDEFKLYQKAQMGERNTGLLKLTNDLRDQIMLLKLSS